MSSPKQDNIGFKGRKRARGRSIEDFIKFHNFLYHPQK